jgi:hypothetical protein
MAPLPETVPPGINASAFTAPGRPEFPVNGNTRRNREVRVSGDTLSAETELVRRRAADLAGQLSRVAGRCATIAQERAVLRMLGVDGLDESGSPLAASLAERYCGSDPDRLARGVLLPFVVALLEYDLPPRELALDAASGAIDLALEGELLERPDRLAVAEQRASELLDAALARFDANRTATHEMRDVLGLPPEPWLGVALRATEVTAAAAEVRASVGGGADVVQVRVPASREFAEARRQAGIETPDRFVFEAPGRDRHRGLGHRRRPGQPAQPAVDAVPAGSQRGLASLREAADDAAAERGCYASLMTVTSAFAAPEQAVVAAFERIDFVEADPIREIVEDSVDPDRALADHAFAHRLQARAGSRVVIGPGPLALGSDVASGIPSGAATHAGRALALQALGVELALADGLPPERLLLGAVPDWIGADGDPRSILLQAWLRRAVFGGHRLMIGTPAAGLANPGATARLVSALSGAAASLVVAQGDAGAVAPAAENLRAAAAAAAAIRSTLGDGGLHGDAADVARGTLRAAADVLARLAADGWESLLGPGNPGFEGERLGRSAVVERADRPASEARFLRGAI